jgi:putative hydrolase of the HAD superfamily
LVKLTCQYKPSARQEKTKLTSLFLGKLTMPGNITTIGFDADDTLWHNETFFRLTQDRFADLLRDYAEPDHLAERLTEAERRNLGHYGFGIKGFVLSMIETAIEVTNQKVPASVIAELIAVGQEMLSHPIHLLSGAQETVSALADAYRLVLITKGDLLDQERKLAQSGLGDMFDAVEIVSDKTPLTYEQAFKRHGSGAAQAVMVGNSLKSDVIPAIQAGAWGVYVPHELTWEVEHATPPGDHPRFRTVKNLEEFPHLLSTISNI